MDSLIEKKRGRKPRVSLSNDYSEINDALKKKRGRKKKYEIENSQKILNFFAPLLK